MPWNRVDEHGTQHSLMHVLAQVHLAVKQMQSVGSAEQVERTIEILKSARKQVYALLAED